jgi:hypothetical protein
MTGMAFGFDIAPAEGCYLLVYFAMFEIAFINPEIVVFEEEE